MTKTLIARGGALSALALVIALCAPVAPVQAQSRTETLAERPQLRAENRGGPQRMQRVERRSERRESRRERAQSSPDRRGFGAEVRRRAERAGTPDARRAATVRQDRPERRAERIDRRGERRAGAVEARGDRRAERLGWQGRDRAARRVDQRSERRAGAIENRGERRAIRVEQRGDRRAGRIDNWRDGRRDGFAGQVNDIARDARRSDWRDGRRGNWRDDRRDFRRDRRNWRRDDWRWGWNGRPGWDRRDFRRWDRGWRGNRTYNWFDFRRGNQFLFRPGPYFAPFRSHRYSRLQTGFFLDSLFFQPRFFINDPWAYHLPPVYGPYQWVRYYDDVLLVDIYTGEVVDVIHDFFW
ncbi:RcnB family protein [Erythrobacter dokdonensis]|uniref:DUF3315 domain-containing protein n=1 Tax=Erythrobacter dokdonensis DSW-74 TaxID=1300349 RepID=A0A1A7BGD7_9SPHN|nr:RcnB family protein [Erythrobacter dokdonensis]OBV11554.1 DUF3315 domain-containing protein [Erythrobacter dokdonensis DSW-74]